MAEIVATSILKHFFGTENIYKIYAESFPRTT